MIHMYINNSNEEGILNLFIYQLDDILLAACSLHYNVNFHCVLSIELIARVLLMFYVSQSRIRDGISELLIVNRSIVSKRADIFLL